MKYMIKDLPIEERPRERFIKYGVNSLSDIELISIILRTGYKDTSVKDVATNLLNNIPLKDIYKVNFNKISSIKGIGSIKAITLLSAIELGKRSMINNNTNKIQITNADIVYNLLYLDLINELQEKLIVLFLDTKKYIISYKTIFIGTVNASTVHPRDIFREAINNNAVSIIMVHNHPTGNPKPSLNDSIFTNKMQSISKMIGIELDDHIIIGKNKYYSYYSEEWCKNEKENL